MKNRKLLIGLLVALALIVGVVALVRQKNSQVAGSAVELITDPAQVEIVPETIAIGKVLYSGGYVDKEYEIRNKSDKTLRLKKIATSCMCTFASVSWGDKKTRYFSMEGHGDKNPTINFEIPGGTTAKINVRFDPAAHGLQGIGRVDRSVYLTFADPIGVREVKFSGEVVLKSE